MAINYFDVLKSRYDDSIACINDSFLEDVYILLRKIGNSFIDINKQMFRCWIDLISILIVKILICFFIYKILLNGILINLNLQGNISNILLQYLLNDNIFYTLTLCPLVITNLFNKFGKVILLISFKV